GIASSYPARSGPREQERVWQRKRIPPHSRDQQATQRPCCTSLHGGRSHRGWETMSEIFCITVQDSLLFHRITPGFSLSMPAQDVSPKARKSPHPLPLCEVKPTLCGV